MMKDLPRQGEAHKPQISLGIDRQKFQDFVGRVNPAVSVDFPNGQYKGLVTEEVASAVATLRSEQVLVDNSFKDPELGVQMLDILSRLQDLHGRGLDGEVLDEASRLCEEVAIRNLPTINSTVSQAESPSYLQKSMDIFGEIVNYPNNDEGISPAADFIVEHLEEALRTDNTRVKDHFWSKYEHIVVQTLIVAPENTDRTIEALRKALENDQSRDAAIRVVSEVATNGRVRAVRSEAQEQLRADLLNPMLKNIGLDLPALISYWQKETGSLVHAKENLETIFMLEKSKPGICSELVKKFGIRSFDRYPQELLVDMVEYEGNTSIPYGIMLTPTKDNWFGAFYGLQSPLADFYKQLKQLGYGLRVFECDGKRQVAEALLRCDQRYGAEQKISFMILGGHGTPEHIQFGSTKRGEGIDIEKSNARAVISKLDFEGRAAQRVGDFLASDANIILLSCSTGEEGGIGQKIAETFPGRRTTAPRVPIKLDKLGVNKSEDGKLQFDVTYSKPQSKREYFSEGGDAQ